MKALATAALLVVSAASLTACIISPPIETAQGPVGVAPVEMSVGWYGDQYYDGHRYWARDEWMRRHPNDQGWNGQHDERRNAVDQNASRRSGDRYSDARQGSSDSNAPPHYGVHHLDRQDQ